MSQVNNLQYELTLSRAGESSVICYCSTYWEAVAWFEAMVHAQKVHYHAWLVDLEANEIMRESSWTAED